MAAAPAHLLLSTEQFGPVRVGDLLRRAGKGEMAAGEALLDALLHATQPRFAMCHEWKVDDLLMWNNLSVLHRRDPFDPKTRRVMHRSQIKGDERIA
jgi:alpha-ketoglutarate-dependent taurine dioxygenase